MRVLFIYPVPAPTNKIYTGYNVGLASVVAVARSEGHHPSLLILERFDADRLRAEVARRQPDCIAISVTSPQMRLAERVVETLATATPAPVIAGGIGVTVEPGRLLTADNVAAEVQGEGERAIGPLLTRLARGEDLADIPNVALPGQAPPRPLQLVESLDSLPFGDRDVFSYQQILDRNRANIGLEMLASRGCPFGCGYCANDTLNALSQSRRVRYRSVGNVTDECRRLLERYRGIAMIGFHDDIFGLDKNWLSQFVEDYPKRVNLPFWCNLRVGAFTEEHLHRLKRAGCFRVHLGVESGSERIRNEVLRRPFRDDDIVDAFEMIRRAGLRAVAFFMLGLPTETEQDMHDTVELARRLHPDWSVVSLFTPYPGTRLAREYSSSVPADLSESYYDDEYVFHGAAADPDAVRRTYRNFVPLVYGRRRARISLE